MYNNRNYCVHTWSMTSATLHNHNSAAAAAAALQVENDVGDAVGRHFIKNANQVLYGTK